MTAQEFKAARLKLGHTQPQFAEKLGYDSYNTILRKEAGKMAVTAQDEIIIKYLMRDQAAAQPVA